MLRDGRLAVVGLHADRRGVHQHVQVAADRAAAEVGQRDAPPGGLQLLGECHSLFCSPIGDDDRGTPRRCPERQGPAGTPRAQHDHRLAGERTRASPGGPHAVIRHGLLDRHDRRQPIRVVCLEPLALPYPNQRVGSRDAPRHLIRLCRGSQRGALVRNRHRQTHPVLVRKRPNEPIEVVHEQRDVHVLRSEPRPAERPVVDRRRLAVRHRVTHDPQHLCIRRLRVQPVQVLQLVDRRLPGRRLPLRTERPKRQEPAVLGRQNPRRLPLLPHTQPNNWPARRRLLHDRQHPVPIRHVLPRRRKLDHVSPHGPDGPHQPPQILVARRPLVVMRRHDHFRLAIRLQPRLLRPERRHEHGRNEKLHVHIRRPHLHRHLQRRQPGRIIPLVLTTLPRRPIRHHARQPQRVKPPDHLLQVPTGLLKVLQKVQPKLHHVTPRLLRLPRLLQHTRLRRRRQRRTQKRRVLRRVKRVVRLRRRRD